jgi:hypothetical protein
MLDHLGRCEALPCAIVLRISLLALLLPHFCWLLHIRFHKRWWWRLLLLQLLDALVGHCQFLLRDAQLLQRLGELFFS